MAVNVYEGMFILDANRYGRDPEAVSGQIPAMIEKAGGEMLVSRLWEERRLAYPIKGHRKGTYWLTYFRLPSDQLAGIQRQCQLSETIIRVLFLKVEPRVVDTLVTHATAGSAAVAAGAGKATSAEQQGPPEAGAVAVADDETGADAPDAAEQEGV